MLSLVIQAGGQSTRIGQDKALMPFLGRPLIAQVIDTLSGLADEILVTSNQPDAYHFLGLRVIQDLIPGRGVLGGLYTALASAKHSLVAVVACDMPFASKALFEHARRLIVREDADVVIPSTDDGLEPLHAVYRRTTCLPAIKSALDADQWKLISWFPKVKVRVLLPDEVKVYDPSGRAFLNLNTPEEFAATEAMIKRNNRQMF